MKKIEEILEKYLIYDAVTNLWHHKKTLFLELNENHLALIINDEKTILISRLDRYIIDYEFECKIKTFIKQFNEKMYNEIFINGKF